MVQRRRGERDHETSLPSGDRRAPRGGVAVTSSVMVIPGSHGRELARGAEQFGREADLAGDKTAGDGLMGFMVGGLVWVRKSSVPAGPTKRRPHLLPPRLQHAGTN